MGRKPRPRPKCTACGLCCISFAEDNDVWAELDPGEADHISKKYRKYIQETDSMRLLERALRSRAGISVSAIRTRWLKAQAGPFKGISFCACALLSGSPLQRVRCEIYEHRPSVCREACKPGDRDCLEVRRLFLQAVDVVKKQRRKP